MTDHQSLPLVYDVGAHTGEDSEYYLKKGFRVVAIEALPRHCEAISRRLETYVRDGRLVILNYAVSRVNGPVSFFEDPRVSVWGTTIAERADTNRRQGSDPRLITVQGIRFADVIREHGIPYFMKVDIEGSDLLCLEGLKEFAERPKRLSIESTKTSFRDLRAEFRLLEELGYRRFKVVQQREVHQQRCPFPAREGDYVDFAFNTDASGMFGEEAPGTWLTSNAAIRKYVKIFCGYRLFGDDGLLVRHWLLKKIFRWKLNINVGWYDTHASLP